MPQPESRRNGGAGGRSPSRCVVVLPRPSPAADALLSGLRGRGAGVTVVPHPPAALVELARHPAGALVVVEPRQVRRLPELLATLCRYYPRVACWQFDPSAPGASGGAAAPLSRVGGPAAAPAEVAPVPQAPGVPGGSGIPGAPAAPSAPSGSPALRRAVDQLLDRDVPEVPPNVPAPLLTQEEVAMLIGRPFEEELVVDDDHDEDKPPDEP